MSWFDRQTKKRKAGDRTDGRQSVREKTGALRGSGFIRAHDGQSDMEDAISEILKFYHKSPRELSGEVPASEDPEEALERIMRPYGIMRRRVKLTKNWYHDAAGAMIGFKKDDGSVIALLPGEWGGYYYRDSGTGKKVRLNRENAGNIEEDAVAFYRPFPLTKLGKKDLLAYMISQITFGDIVMLAASILMAAGVGLFIPWLNRILFSDVLVSGSIRMLTGTAIFMICAAISRMLFTSIQSMMSARISSRISFTTEAAAMMRVLSLPPSFFRDFSAGELNKRTEYFGSICSQSLDMILNTGLTAVFSLIYVSQILIFAPALAAPALIVTLATLVISIIQVVIQFRILRKSMKAAGKESGLTYQLISGIQKIKLAGAERRAYLRWGRSFAEMAQYTYDPPLFLKISSVLTLAISLAGTGVIYGVSIRSNVSVAEYYAFNSAYGMVNSAFLALAGIAAGIARIRPALEMVQPIMEAQPETAEEKEIITQLHGKIELKNISFEYKGNDRTILDDLSLTILPGQYVAIVGETGCGKSTLLRVMLGFETPREGTVYYDGKDIKGIDLPSLRRRIGTVMQNGKLFYGDIYSNIAILAPRLTVEEAWEAAETAGIAEDIREMPMGMYTVVSEGQGGISGGQRQRLLIARAIAPKPRILMLDEATSALDNLTQKRVSEALDQMKCTRIVIAHRLSTIRQCDRILMLDQGKIVEDGTYEELLAKNGHFAEMVERQRLH